MNGRPKKLERLVPSLYTCRALADAGLHVGDVLWWAPGQPDGEWVVSSAPTGGVGVPAPDRHDLFEALPQKVVAGKDKMTFDLQKYRLWTGYLSRPRRTITLFRVRDDNTAEHRARALLRLHEQGLLPANLYLKNQ